LRIRYSEEGERARRDRILSELRGEGGRKIKRKLSSWPLRI